MATKSIVPRASGEGGLGTSSKLWKEAHHVTASFGDVSLVEDASNRLQVSGGPLVAASGLSGSLTQLSDGSSYLVEGSNISITTGSSGQITIASPLAGVVEDLNTLGAASADGEFIVATGAGAFAYESGATVRTSLGLGTGDSPTFTDLTLSGDLTVNGTTTTVNTDNLLVEDPVVLLGTGASAANTNGGVALLSGSSVSGESLVIGRVDNDTWGVGRKDVQGGAVTTLADMTLVDFKAAGITASGLTLGSTAVTSTATELNLLDTSAISAASGSSLRYDGTNLQWEAFSGGGGGLSNVVEDTTPQLGGTLDLNSQAIQGDLVPSAAATYDLGSTTAEWANVYLSDSGKIYFGNDQDFYLERGGNTSLRLRLPTPQDDTPTFEAYSMWSGVNGPTISLYHNSPSPAASDIIGSIYFKGEDSASNVTFYSTIESEIVSTTNASETGKINLNVLGAGTEGTALEIEGSQISAGGTTVNVADHNGSTLGLKLGGTLVTANAAELNLLDGGTSVGSSITLQNSDGFIVNDGGTMKLIPASDLSTFVGGGGGGSGGGKHGLTETKTASFTTTAFSSAEERQLYIVDSASAVTATLADPGATTYDGYEINIKRLGAGTVHITGSTGVLGIDGSATFDLPSQYSSVTLVATGSQYVII